MPRRLNTPDEFFFKSREIHLQFSIISKLEYMLIFFLIEKRKRIHFCDISAALADVVAEAPYIFHERFTSVTLPFWCYRKQPQTRMIEGRKISELVNIGNSKV